VFEERSQDSPVRILYTVEDTWGSAWYRCHVPGVELMRHGAEVVTQTGTDWQLFEQCNIAVFQRPSDPQALRAISTAGPAGKLAVVDLDDDLWNIHPSNPGYRPWQKPGKLATLEECIRRAHLVTVSTEPLVPIVRPMNRNVVVLPNMLPSEHWPADLTGRPAHDPLTIGWAGGASHAADLDLLSGTIETILDAHPDVEFAFAGMRQAPFRPHPRIRSIASVTVEQYASVLDQFDIGVIPLVDDRFNRCKSDLKYLEYSMMGIPSVVSKVEPYQESVRHGVNGFLARNPKDWLKHLNRLIDDAELRATIGAQARAFAESRTIEDNIRLWARAYGLTE
jgi:hypothetical protein